MTNPNVSDAAWLEIERLLNIASIPTSTSDRLLDQIIDVVNKYFIPKDLEGLSVDDLDKVCAFVCDKKGHNFQRNGFCTASNPPQFTEICTTCGKHRKAIPQEPFRYIYD